MHWLKSFAISMFASMRYGGIFDLENKRTRLLEVQRELEDPAVWQNPEKSQQLGRERVALQGVIQQVDSVTGAIKDAQEIASLVKEDKDPQLMTELNVEVNRIEAI